MYKLIPVLFLIVGVVLPTAVLIFVFGLDDHSLSVQSPELCLTITPSYLLSCEVNGSQRYVQANNQTIDKALSKNNCSIITRHDVIDIIYCYQKVDNGTQKYKLFISPYS